VIPVFYFHSFCHWVRDIIFCKHTHTVPLGCFTRVSHNKERTQTDCLYSRTRWCGSSLGLWGRKWRGWEHCMMRSFKICMHEYLGI
jgi:hypothetical protein